MADYNSAFTGAQIDDAVGKVERNELPYIPDTGKDLDGNFELRGPDFFSFVSHVDSGSRTHVNTMYAGADQISLSLDINADGVPYSSSISIAAQQVAIRVGSSEIYADYQGNIVFNGASVECNAGTEKDNSVVTKSYVDTAIGGAIAASY
jgi:hypothetical protein